eukprot:1491374-Pyramimonas_sp.AAC.1
MLRGGILVYMLVHMHVGHAQRPACHTLLTSVSPPAATGSDTGRIRPVRGSKYYRVRWIRRVRDSKYYRPVGGVYWPVLPTGQYYDRGSLVRQGHRRVLSTDYGPLVRLCTVRKGGYGIRPVALVLPVMAIFRMRDRGAERVLTSSPP